MMGSKAGVMLTATEIKSLRRDMLDAGITISYASEVLGVSRPHLSKMMNGRADMPRMYDYALRYLLSLEAA